jgi:translation initiation factor 1
MKTLSGYWSKTGAYYWRNNRYTISYYCSIVWSHQKNMKNSNLVWSSELGGRVEEVEEEIQPQGDGTACIRRETKSRGGKTVITITGLLLDKKELSDLNKKLKKRCGTGGTVKNGVIEIQGNVIDAVNDLLVKEGFKVKKVGG